jgi:hypothetical protein
MRRLRTFLSQRRDKDGGEGENGHPPKDLQRVDGSVDEREGTDVIELSSTFKHPSKTLQMV